MQPWVFLAWLQAFIALASSWQRSRSTLAMQSTFRSQSRPACLCCGSSCGSWPSRGWTGLTGGTRGCWHVVPSLCDSMHSMQLVRQSGADWWRLGRLRAITHSLGAALFPSWHGPLPYWLFDRPFRFRYLSQLWASGDIGGRVRLAWLFGVFSCRLRKARLIFLVKYSVR